MVISELIRKSAERLKENPRFEAELIVMKALDISRIQLITEGKRPVEDGKVKTVLEMLRRRGKGEPLQYILGETEFMSLEFYTERGVLIPRADTETLVQTVIGRVSENDKIFDACSGSGCVGISIAYYCPRSRVDMADISPAALKLAEKNARRNNVSDRVKIFKMDIIKECPKEKYDIIVSNPPYIETDVIETLDVSVKDYEPRAALDGGADGLAFYRRMVEIAPEILKSGGSAAFEIGFNQGRSVPSVMSKSFEDVKVIKDLCGNDRVVVGRMKG